MYVNLTKKLNTELLEFRVPGFDGFGPVEPEPVQTMELRGGDLRPHPERALADPRVPHRQPRVQHRRPEQAADVRVEVLEPGLLDFVEMLQEHLRSGELVSNALVENPELDRMLVG